MKRTCPGFLLPPHVLKKVHAALASLESSGLDLASGKIEKLEGHSIYYRYKLYDYRIGFAIEGNTIVLMRVLHRKDIYNKFP